MVPTLTSRFGVGPGAGGRAAGDGAALAVLRARRQRAVDQHAVGGAGRGVRRPDRARGDPRRPGRPARAARGVDRPLRPGDRDPQPDRRPGGRRTGPRRAHRLGVVAGRVARCWAAFLVPRLVRSMAPQPGPGPSRYPTGRGARRAGAVPGAVRGDAAPAAAWSRSCPSSGRTACWPPRPCCSSASPGAVTRWRAGMLADRLGSRLLLPIAMVVSAVGMALTAVGLWTGPAWVLIGAAVFGAGYGATQNLTLLAAFARAGEGGTTTASAMWNIAFDAGIATGALALGFLAAGIGLDWTYVVVAGLLAAAAAAGLRGRPVRRPFLSVGLDPVGEVPLAADQRDLLAGLAQPLPQVRRGRCGGRRATRPAAPGGCWPGRAGPAGGSAPRRGRRRSARRRGTPGRGRRPGRRGERRRRRRRRPSRVRNSSARRRPSAAGSGEVTRTTVPRPAAGRGRPGGAVAQASRRRKASERDHEQDGDLAGEHREAGPRGRAGSG